MRNLINTPSRLQEYFDNKWLLWTLFLLAVILKSVLLRSYLYIDGDRGLQVVAALELAKGNGYTIPLVDLNNINQVTNRVLLEWPPLYSIILAALLKITDGDLITSSMVIETTGVIVYLGAIWWLAKFIGLPRVVQMMLVWFKATEVYEGMYYSFPTDIIATACLLWAVYYFMKWLDQHSFHYILIVAVFLSAAFLFRYIYITSLFVLPVLLIWNGWNKKGNKYVRAGLVMALLVSLSIIIYLGFNKINTGSFTYLEEWKKGFYPAKAFNLVPLFWQAITHVTFLCMQFSILFDTPFSLFHSFLKRTSEIILVLMIISWIIRTSSYDLLLQRSRDQQYFLSSGLICIPFMVVLIILSIRIDFSTEDGGGWSYLIEDRYFLFPLTLILFAISWRLYMRQWSRPGLQQVLKIAFVSALAFQVTHTVYIVAKRTALIKTEDPFFPDGAAAGWSSYKALLNEGRINGNDVVLFSLGYGDAFFAAQEKVKVFRLIRDLRPDSRIKLIRPTTVVLSMPSRDIKYLAPFLDRYGFQPRKSFSNTVHFITHLKPVVNE